MTREPAAKEFWRRASFGGCDCQLGRTVCDCTLSRLPLVIEPVPPDLPINARTLMVALIVVALACAVSSLFPWGFS